MHTQLRSVPYVSLSHTKVKVLNTKVNALSVRKVKLVRRNKLANRGFTWWITYFFSHTYPMRLKAKLLRQN
ncbi:hypothetical protein J14TS5_64590 [Paenibacillus lautus]|nr:hypothetical protein J14TS5_64590 [Paenibacillus lautus]